MGGAPFPETDVKSDFDHVSSRDWLRVATWIGRLMRVTQS